MSTNLNHFNLDIGNNKNDFNLNIQGFSESKSLFMRTIISLVSNANFKKLSNFLVVVTSSLSNTIKFLGIKNISSTANSYLRATTKLIGIKKVKSNITVYSNTIVKLIGIKKIVSSVTVFSNLISNISIVRNIKSNITTYSNTIIKLLGIKNISTTSRYFLNCVTDFKLFKNLKVNSASMLRMGKGTLLYQIQNMKLSELANYTLSQIQNLYQNNLSVVVKKNIKFTNTQSLGLEADLVVMNAVDMPCLSGLTLATVGSTLIEYLPSPFDKDTIEYSTNVAYAVNQIVVTPTTDISSATITVNGVALTGGYVTVDLAAGDNFIPVIVTNSAVTKTYTIDVIRAPHNTRLSNLVITKVGLGIIPVWDYTFNSYRLDYILTTSAGNVTVTPSLDDSTSTYIMKVNNIVTPITSNVAVPNTVTIEVSSEFGIPPTTYTITLKH